MSVLLLIGAIREKFTGRDPDECIAEVDEALRPWNANIDDLIDNWRPTGYYTPEQMEQVNKFITQTVLASAEALVQANKAMQLEDHSVLLYEAEDEIKKFFPIQFADAVRDAKAKNVRIIQATGYKRFIVDTLQAARDAKRALLFVDCARPHLLFAIAKALGAAADALIAAAKAVGRAVKAIGEAVVKVFDAAGFALKVLSHLPVILLVVGGYYVATKTVLPPKYDPLRLRERETFKPWQRKAVAPAGVGRIASARVRRPTRASRPVRAAR